MQLEFQGPGRGSQALIRCLSESIAAAGPTPFAAFMASALYHPDYGYYTSAPGPWVSSPDFLTAPQIGPALGDAIATLAAAVDVAIDRPDRFDLVDIGSGDGRLIRSTLTALQQRFPGLWRRVRACSVERGQSGRESQIGELPDVPGGFDLVADLEQVASGLTGLVYSNELLDAFPVHRVVLRDGVLLEGHVDVDEAGFVERFLPPSTEAIEAHLAHNGVDLREGQIAEVCLAAEPWGQQVGARLARGGWLTIDYGHETSTLYNESRPIGTLVCQRRFTLHDDPLRCPGSDDITTQVDFGNLRRIAQEQGFAGGELCSLRVFLIGLCATAPGRTDDPAWLALRHLLVSEIGEAHRTMWLTRGFPHSAVPFGRARLAAGEGDAADRD